MRKLRIILMLGVMILGVFNLSGCSLKNKKGEKEIMSGETRNYTEEFKNR